MQSSFPDKNSCVKGLYSTFLFLPETYCWVHESSYHTRVICVRQKSLKIFTLSKQSSDRLSVIFRSFMLSLSHLFLVKRVCLKNNGSNHLRNTSLVQLPNKERHKSFNLLLFAKVYCLSLQCGEESLFREQFFFFQVCF